MRFAITLCVLLGVGCNDPAPFPAAAWKAYDPYAELFYFEGGVSVTGATPPPGAPLHLFDSNTASGCPSVGDDTDIVGTYPNIGSSGDVFTAAGTPRCHEEATNDWAVAFDKINDYFTVAEAVFDDLPQPFTWCMETSIADDDFYVLWDSNTTALGDRSQLARVNTAGANDNELQVYSGSSATTAGKLNVADQYYCVCGLQDGASSKLSIDGAIETGLSTGTDGLDSLTIGARASTRAFKLSGRVTVLGFWDSDIFNDAVTWDCGGLH